MLVSVSFYKVSGLNNFHMLGDKLSCAYIFRATEKPCCKSNWFHRYDDRLFISQCTPPKRAICRYFSTLFMSFCCLIFLCFVELKLQKPLKQRRWEMRLLSWHHLWHLPSPALLYTSTMGFTRWVSELTVQYSRTLTFQRTSTRARMAIYARSNSKLGV